MIPLQKPFPVINCPKIRLRYFPAGAHIGTPLRLYLKTFRAFVGADLCVRPQVRYCLLFQLCLPKFPFCSGNIKVIISHTKKEHFHYI